MNKKRVFLIVIDSVGIGYAHDADSFGDVGANTIVNIAKFNGGISLPNMEKLGYGNITDILGVKKVTPNGYYGKLVEVSNGKDTMTGHWEMMGIKTETPFITFTETGFPADLIKQIEENTSRRIVGNKAASGTEIIEEYGKHQEKTGDLIVYTSADSVLQIAANEDIIPLQELYSICKMTRKLMMKPEWLVGRIIARPYVKVDGKYKRTSNRHDYAVSPTGETVLDSLKENNYDVISVGKINDIFNTCGITKHYGIKSNHDGMGQTTEICKTVDFNGLCFVNLVDFDALYGHRRDPIGYKNCLEEFDQDLGILMNEMREDDILMITADHGNDPTFSGTDHTRENVPILVYSKKFENSGSLGTLTSFACLGKTIAEYFSVPAPQLGESFLKELK